MDEEKGGVVSKAYKLKLLPPLIPLSIPLMTPDGAETLRGSIWARCKFP